MNKFVSTKQIQKLDKTAIDKFHIPSIVLMENAGRLAAMHIEKLIIRRKNPKVAVLCGQGNNAGDGFVVARHLYEMGAGVKVYCLVSEKSLKGDALINFNIIRKLKIPVQLVSSIKVLKEIKKYDVCVDAIFGVGLNRKISSPILEFIEYINAHAQQIVAMDVPSGLNADTGVVMGAAILAKKTITFSYAKSGFFKNEGPRYTGRITVVDIGIPRAVKSQLSLP